MATKTPAPSDEDFFAAAAKEPPLPDGGEPFALFDGWMEEAKKTEPNDPNAMALATVDADGLPDVRMVLLKGVDARGFVFYTNTLSAKGVELGAAPSSTPLALRVLV